jgi:hypothetical protein
MCYENKLLKNSKNQNSNKFNIIISLKNRGERMLDIHIMRMVISSKLVAVHFKTIILIENKIKLSAPSYNLKFEINNTDSEYTFIFQVCTGCPELIIHRT